MLSHLEITTSATAGDMVVGRRVELRSETQVVAAGWCYKTILLLQLVRLSTRSPAYFAAPTVSISNLLILCGGRSSASEEPVRVATRAAGKARLRLWPASLRPVSWPPPASIEDLSASSITGAGTLHRHRAGPVAAI